MILFVLIFDLDISGDTRLTSEFHWNSIFWLCVRERTYVPRPNTQTCAEQPAWRRHVVLYWALTRMTQPHGK